MKNLLKNWYATTMLFSGFALVLTSMTSIYLTKIKNAKYTSHLSENKKVLSVTSEKMKETTFYYDGSGARIAKIEKNGNHTYYISPGLEIVIKPDGSYLYRKNYYFGGRLVAVKEGP